MPSTGFLPKQWRHQHQRHHSLEGYVCKGGNVRLIKRFDSDWIVFAKNNDGDAFAHVGSMEDRPTCQDVENVGRERGWVQVRRCHDAVRDDEECELVAVQLIRHRLTLVVSSSVVSVDNVWAILTDYDDLSKHVPNLVASRQISNKGGDPGDGSHRCRLYQRGLVPMLPWTCQNGSWLLAGERRSAPTPAPTYPISQ